MLRSILVELIWQSQQQNARHSCNTH